MFSSIQMFRPAPALRVGAVRLPNRVVLAPMSGVTDAPFRRLVSRLGAGLVVSEMTASDALVEGQRNAVLRAEGQGTGWPFWSTTTSPFASNCTPPGSHGGSSRLGVGEGSGVQVWPGGNGAPQLVP